MDFTLPDTHRELAELAGTILEAHGAVERHNDLERPSREGPAPGGTRPGGDVGWFDREAWRSLADAGLLGVPLSPDVGGLGLDALATHLVLHRIGATAAHVPWFEAVVLGARTIDRFGGPQMRRDHLPRLVAGELVLTAALVDEDGADPRHPTTQATPDGAGWVLDGVKALVPCLQLADHVLVTAVADDREPVIALVATDAPGVAVEAQATPSDVPHARLVLQDVVVDGGCVLASGVGARAVLDELVDHARAGLASMQAGVVEAAVALAAAHTSSREQFGRPIATFQAVSQRVADARIAQEMLALTSLQAAWLLARGLPATEELLIAAWWTCEAGHEALHAAHHVHGGIGVDRDYPLHRLFGRAKLHEFLLGHAERALADLGARLAADPSQAIDD